MSVFTTTSAESRRELAYRLHRLGLNGGGDEVPPSYRRSEEALRRAARVPLPKAEEAPQTIAAALTEPLDTRDMAWFSRREQAGEAAEVARVEASLVTAVDTLWPRAVPETPLATLVVSPALRPLPFYGPNDVVLAGPETPAELLVLAALVLPHVAPLAARFDEAKTPIGAAARRFATLMVGGSIFNELTPRPELLDQVLVTVVRDLLPPQHRGEEVERWIGAVSSLLDQPPGEIERTIHGLARRRADRVHRAWGRRFFVPRGYDLAPM